MAVLVEAFSVIVPVEVLEAKYPGGLAAYETHRPNRTFCCDGRLTRIGFMLKLDAIRFIDSLVRLGLCDTFAGAFADLALAEQEQGVLLPCPWLQFLRHPSGYAFAWHCAHEPGELAVPEGWCLEGSLSASGHSVQVDALQFVRREENVDVYFDAERDTEVTISRTLGHTAWAERKRREAPRPWWWSALTRWLGPGTRRPPRAEGRG